MVHVCAFITTYFCLGALLHNINSIPFLGTTVVVYCFVVPGGKQLTGGGGGAE